MPLPLLPPEVRLLLIAASPDRKRSDTELATLLASPLDWTLIGRLAEREKLVPVLRNALQEHAAVIPAHTATALQRQASVTEFRMAMTETALRQVVEELAANGIQVMLLKGAALATTIYPSFGSRPMGDLDILVAAHQAERAWTRMRELGWKLELPGSNEFHQSHHHLPGLLDPGGLNVVLEIHRAMLPPSGPFDVSESDVWADARTLTLGRTAVRVPSDIHQLLHLCVHFAWSHTLLEGLGRTVRDVATLLDACEMRWPEFVNLAVRAKAGTCAYWTLSLSATLAGARVPAGVLESLRPRQPRTVSRALERAYVMSGLLGSCPSLRLARMLWTAGVQPVTSGHGAARPWHVSDRFSEFYYPGRRRGIGARITEHARRLSDWIQFAAVVGRPRPVR
jgi:hypothetical protein